MANTVTVKDLVDSSGFIIISGKEFLDKKITTAEISRPGLELTGFFTYYPSTRIQLLGMTELTFTERMTSEERLVIMRRLCQKETPCFVIGRRLEAPAELVKAAQEAGIPILSAQSRTTRVSSNITNFLEGKLAERVSMHGVLVDVFGMGVMITGDSGVGKSETALELIQKGHRLVADDRVDLYQHDENTLIGEAPSILRHLIEIRGIGIIDVMTLFGAGAVKQTNEVNLIVNLEMWSKEKKFDRLGSTEELMNILEVDVPRITIPVKTGRNLAIIIEVAAMNFRAKNMGYNAAETFEKNLEALIEENKLKEE
ncbi:hpr serine kinase n terminus [Trichococcus palustris]|jgi:HPr kinase/phosphorylase|uniref:HPr kinase/phosphorylase n=1 Tax=Trichococcus palustris TaxID=140314 RepID=A0A143YKV0_9LACT|nr:HPr(Ser) kinase/phosphatase [Trichococcus palustris]CZQ91400.1 hpr serine kinase n terminus [Trichococcus palustris]SFL02105.1 Hpr(Ser) kinase/phosphatase [Trichococcus palustris]